jgi:TolB protein
VQLTVNTTIGDNFPRLHPDGSQITYESTVTGNVDIWTMGTDGSNQLNLTEAVVVNDGQPAWSSDGNHIAFVSRRDDISFTKLFRMTAAGGDVTQLTLGNHDVRLPSWNGPFIAYESNAAGNADIWVKLASDTDDGTNLTAVRTRDDRMPAFSPDGQKIAFVSSVDDTDTDLEIFVMNANGTGVIQLTDNDFTDMSPSWSPDGSKIVYASNGDGTLDIWVTDTAGVGAVNLTADLPDSSEDMPHWGLYAP